MRTQYGDYIKDLRIFRNISLENLILVDNAVTSFGEQLSNGIPIPSYKEDPDDRELVHLIKYLDVVLHYEDMREANAQAFMLQALFEKSFDDWIDYYCDNEECERLMEEERAGQIAEHEN